MLKSPTVDVLVVGSGASGLTAAITAAKAGLDVLVVEKEAVFGGTSATSGGGLWIPNSPHSEALQKDAGFTDDVERARRYILEEAGNYAQRDRVDAYLSTAPAMIRFLEAETHVRFNALQFPDYQSDSIDSSLVRTIVAADYDARELGEHAPNLKRPLPQMEFLGMAVGLGPDLVHFLRAGRSARALAFTLGKLARHLLQVLRYGQGQMLVAGRALVARLARTLFDLGVPLWLDSPVERLIDEDGAITGADIRTPSGIVRITARRGVVLACGGFPNDIARRDRVFPGPAGGPAHRNLVPSGNSGDGIRLAEAVGGQFNAAVAQPAAWMPVSVLPGSRDSTGVAQHLIDRNKPGFLMVLPNGQRFANESMSYHHLIPELLAACAGEAEAYCWLIGDHAAVRKWGIGWVRPFPAPHHGHLRSGYLLRGKTLTDLAAKCGIDGGRLDATVARFNAGARKGEDPDFGRGGHVYDRCMGDWERPDNPSLGPLEKPPFYAVRVKAGLIATFAGLKTDANARVLDTHDQPIPGLYAVGNDQASVFGGTYPGAGATLGPGMTFGYIAGKHLAELSEPTRR